MHLRLIVNNGVLNRKSEHPRKTFVWAFFFYSFWKTVLLERDE